MMEGMVFYKAWFDALADVPAEEFKSAVMAMAAYGMDDEEPDLDGIAKVIFTMARPTIDRRKADSENGSKGGRPSKKPTMQETKRGVSENQKGGFSKPKSTETETETETDKNTIVPPETGRRGEPIPYQAVIDHLNRVCGTKYAATTAKTRECIRARCREGATLEDFITVIDRKANEWLGTDRAMYLRPETLFGTKFDGYLNAPRAAPKKAAKQFNDFHQRDQDYDAISKALIEKQLATLGATSVVDAAQWHGIAKQGEATQGNGRESL